MGDDRRVIKGPGYTPPPEEESLWDDMTDEEFLAQMGDQKIFEVPTEITRKIMLAIHKETGERLFPKDIIGCRIVPGDVEDGKISLLLFDEIGNDEFTDEEIPDGFRGEVVLKEDGSVSINFTFFDNEGIRHEEPHQEAEINPSQARILIAALSARDQLTSDLVQEEEGETNALRWRMGLKRDTYSVVEGDFWKKFVSSARDQVPILQRIGDFISSLKSKPPVLDIDLSVSSLTGKPVMVSDASPYKDSLRTDEAFAADQQAIEEEGSKRGEEELRKAQEAAEDDPFLQELLDEIEQEKTEEEVDED